MTAPGGGIGRFARGRKTTNASSNAPVPAEKPSETTECPGFDNMFGGGGRMDEDSFGGGNTFLDNFGGYNDGDTGMFGGGFGSSDSPKKSSQEEMPPPTSRAMMERVSTNEQGGSNAKESVTNGAPFSFNRNTERTVGQGMSGGLSMAAPPAERPKTPSSQPSRNATNAPAGLSRFSQKRAPATPAGPYYGPTMAQGAAMAQRGGLLPPPPAPMQRAVTTTVPPAMGNTNTGMSMFSNLQGTTTAAIVEKTPTTTTNKDTSDDEDARVLPPPRISPKTPGQTNTTAAPSTITPKASSSLWNSNAPAFATPSPAATNNKNPQESDDDSMLVTPDVATSGQGFDDLLSNFVGDLQEGVDRLQHGTIELLDAQVDLAISYATMLEQRNVAMGLLDDVHQVYDESTFVEEEFSQLLQDVENARVEHNQAMERLSLMD